MSIQITTSMVKQYSANLYMLSQQKDTRLRKAVWEERVTGAAGFFDQLGVTAMRERTSRHADTPRMDTPHSRRMVIMRDFEWSDLVDKEDEVRLLTDPTSKYARLAANAANRQIDDLIIEAATGTAYTGETGATSTSYDSTNMTVAATKTFDGVTSTSCGLNVAKILDAKAKLGAQNVDDDDDCWMVINSRQRQSLLQDIHIASRDFNLAQPLMDGKVAKFGGFNIVVSERLATYTTGGITYDRVLYWASGGILLGVARDVSGRISERPDKSYSTQVFAAQTMGATRMEEARVGSVLCHQTLGPSG